MVKCGSCGEGVRQDQVEACWFCLADLCPGCWDRVGHCGHPEAEVQNARSVLAHVTSALKGLVSETKLQPSAPTRLVWRAHVRPARFVAKCPCGKDCNRCLLAIEWGHSSGHYTPRWKYQHRCDDCVRQDIRDRIARGDTRGMRFCSPKSYSR